MEDQDTAFIQEVLEEGFSFESLGNELSQLIDAQVAVKQYGINPTALAIMQTTNLLNSTALDKVAIESFIFDEPTGVQSQLAIESLGEKIKEKAAVWSARILTFIKSTASAAFDKLGDLFKKVTDKFKEFASGTWETAKSHPVKTVLGTLAAIGAVIGVITFCSSNLPSAVATRETFNSLVTRTQAMFNKINLPFGKVSATVTEGTLSKLKVDIPSVKSSGEAAVKTLVDWTKADAYNTATKVESLWANTMRGWNVFKASSIKMLTGAGSSLNKGIKDLATGVISLPVKVQKATGNPVLSVATAGTLYLAACVLLATLMNSVIDLTSYCMRFVKSAATKLVSSKSENA